LITLYSQQVTYTDTLCVQTAGTSGFLISLLGLIIPNKLRQRPQASSSSGSTSSGSSSRHRSSSRRTSATPSLHSYINSSTTGTRSSSSSSYPQGHELDNLIIPSSRSALKNTTHTRTWPMSRGNSASSSSAAAGIPELHHSSSNASCSGSCSSSIISEGVIEPLHPVEESTVHGAMSFLNKCKGSHFNRSRKNSRVSLHAAEEDSLVNTEASDKNKTSRRSRTRSMSPRSSSNSKISADAVRARLSLIIPHHNHSNTGSSSPSSTTNNKETDKRNRRSSFILRRSASPTLSNGSNTSSPLLGPSRSSTMQDAEVASNQEVSSSGNIHSKKVMTAIEGSHATRPPFLTRMFTFSSFSSSSSSSAGASSKSSSSTLPSSAGTSSTSNLQGRVSEKKSSSTISISPITVTEQDTPVESTIAAVIAARPKSRRLSTRLTSFRSSSSSSSKSHRAIGEGDSHVAASHLPVSAEVANDEASEMMPNSPPQTPRLDSQHTFQQGEETETPTSSSSSLSLPLRSPLIKRSFFSTQSPSSKTSFSNTGSTSPSTLKKERPYSPRRVASESYHQAQSHSTNTAHGVQTMNSPGKIDRHTTMNALKMGVLPSLPVAVGAVAASSESTAPGAVAPALPLQRGRTVYGRFQSDATTPVSQNNLQSRYPSSSPQQQHQQNQQKQQAQLQRHARHVSDTSASAAPRGASSASSPPRPASSMSMSMNNTSRNKTNNGQSFIPFVPFSDVQYRKSTLDLSGGSALTMSVHFEEESR
jgi:hypothetical protein